MSKVLKFERPAQVCADAGKKSVKPKRTRNPPTRAMLLRTMKLGEDTMRKIKGTSLDSAHELDELIVLNRGAEEGELTPIVRKLVDAAAAGKDVSAIGFATKMGGRATRPIGLIACWRKRMVSTWELASDEERMNFLAFLGMKFEMTKRAALLDYLIEHITILKTTEPEP